MMKRSNHWCELHILNGEIHENVEKEIPVRAQYCLVGRKTHNPLNVDVKIQCENTILSRNHCILQRKGLNEYYLRDSRSKNGTFVNYERLRKGGESPLKDGDTIILGGGYYFGAGTNVNDLFDYWAKHPKEDLNIPIRSQEQFEKHSLIFKFVISKDEKEKIAKEKEQITGKKRKRSEEQDESLEEDHVIKKQKVGLTEEENALLMIQSDKALKKKLELSIESVRQRAKKLESVNKEVKGMNALRNDVEMDIRCDICLGLLFHPITLPCSHHYCLECLTLYINGKSRSDKKCCRCRQNILNQQNKPIRNYYMDELIEKMMPYMSEEDQEEHKDRVQKYKNKELQSRKEYETLLKSKGGGDNNSYFPSIEQNWNNFQKLMIQGKAEKFFGNVRKEYLKDLGFTEQWIERATISQLKTAVSNFGLFVPENCCFNCLRIVSQDQKVDIEGTRDTVKSFFEGTYLELK